MLWWDLYSAFFLSKQRYCSTVFARNALNELNPKKQGLLYFILTDLDLSRINFTQAEMHNVLNMQLLLHSNYQTKIIH